MNKVIIICLAVLALAGCKKTEDALAEYKATAAADDKAIADYIAKNGLTATKVMIGNQDTTGVWYVNTTIGTENALYTSSSLLTLGYAGRQMGSSTVFAQTTNFHPAFRLGDMIKGWQYGIQKSQMRKGGKIRLFVASRYAYGPYEQPGLGLPKNAILDFDIELFDVTN